MRIQISAEEFSCLPDHDGSTYQSGLDKGRLNKQQARVYQVVLPIEEKEK